MSVRRPQKIISGGQTGVDRAALDVALALGIPCGGWCPKDRQAEDGPIETRYPLQETPKRDHAQRTEWNVRDSDGTLILAPGPLTGGTALTSRLARTLRKPCLVVDPFDPEAARDIGAWCRQHAIDVLNVAGPRESHAPGIGAQAAILLQQVLAQRSHRT